jgi:CheY-like chemotaxis protein
MKVLFADDSATMRRVAEITFSIGDFELILVSEGAKVIEQVKDSRPNLVVLDSDMPGVDGYQACAQIRQDPLSGQVPVLILTGPSSPWEEAKGLDAGTKEHMDKPFETQAMLDRVAAMGAAGIEQEKPKLSPKPQLTAPLHTGARAPAAPIAATPMQRTQASTQTRMGIGPGSVQLDGPTWPPDEPAKSPVQAAPAARPAPRHAPVPLGKPAGRPQEGKIAAITSMTQAATDKAIAQTGSSLSPEQVEAVRKIARDVVERVVWEVVPDLAETIIKEELAKLLRE